MEAYITHGVLSKGGAQRMEKSALSRLVITDTIPAPENNVLKVISVANMFAEAIRRVHHDESISVLFE